MSDTNRGGAQLNKSATGTSDHSLPGHASPSSRGAALPFSTATGGFANLRQAALAAEAEQRAQKRQGHEADDPYAGLSPKERRIARRAARRLRGTFEDYPHLLAIKPREGYVFRSDYYDVDGSAACVLGFFHDEAARDDFGAFWGINRIPANLGDGVSVVVFEQVRRMGEKWIDDRISTSDRIGKLEQGEQNASGTASTRRKAEKVSSDIDIATAEIQDGASYLHVHNRLLVKAPTLTALEEAVDRIKRLYIDRFGTVSVAAYPGEQRQELSALTRANDKKRGRGQHFTSVEYAGSHSLVTNGLNDPSGEYVGSMLGDVNTSAVLFDVNAYERHVVVADSSLNTVLGRAHVPDMWGSKISQSAMLNNGRVVHLVLDGADLDKLGPKFSALTASLNMSSGDINMFEMFGDREEELSIFPAHLDKIVLMAEQAYETTDDDRSIIRGSLKETLTQFYIDKGMWSRNAKTNRSRLRLVDLDHRHVPRLQDLVSYFDTKYRELSMRAARDDEALHAYNVLRLVFTDLLDNNGDLFNTHTNDAIDGVFEARRVVYDFSKLLRRGHGIAMAQLVNTVGFAVDNLSLGDTVIIHGTEHIADRVKGYIHTQFERLFARGGRVAYLYNDVEKMLADASFNRFERADWTVLGPMGDKTVADYQKHLAQDIPPDLERLVTTKNRNLAYLRRGVTNVVFSLDLALGMNPARAAHRERIERERRLQAPAAAATSGRRPTAAVPSPEPIRQPVMRPRTLPGAVGTRPAPIDPPTRLARTR
ncbi:hypothetical protein SAMN06295974_3701 [Plantibacter flavus]|uniref:Uncharacterized protein n=1 Tax=Plantibacter flavus TaxID=150123 RepID=A0A3N2BLQ1_9MICO|nr:hypothetical protein [Plantibacter flavus]ROR75964.1 hypothetical protein EDD42_3915 [Plantibacter flavus]SMG48243.1 hypothetical protein SAMN06295974_3701 [Plantibacter flavus]